MQNNPHHSEPTGRCTAFVLSRTANGTVTACGCRPVVHIEFGNCQLDMPWAAFPDLVEMIAVTDVDELAVVGTPTTTPRPYLLAVSGSPVGLRFSSREYDEFRTLLARTRRHSHFLKTGSLATMRN